MMTFMLVDIDGKDLYVGDMVGMARWLLAPDQRFLYTHLQEESWRDREDVVALHLSSKDGHEVCQLDPELTRQFLNGIPTGGLL